MAKIPRVDLFSPLLYEACVFALVTFVYSLAPALYFAKLDGYDIDSNQELIAFGSANIFGSFFGCFPVGGIMSRSALAHSAGGKTQMATLISCGIMIFAISFIGPLFYHLPTVSRLLPTA